jgi:hypothetical protein
LLVVDDDRRIRALLSRFLFAKLPSPQVPNPCNLKSDLGRKNDSRSTA